jgi:hypothetical protein
MRAPEMKPLALNSMKTRKLHAVMTLALALGCALALLLVTTAFTTVLAQAAPPVKSTAKPRPVTITRDKINAILAAGDRAVARRDVNGITAFMAPNIVIKATTQGQGGFSTWNRSQYRTYLAQVFRQGQRYSYQRSTVRIAIRPNGQSALITSTVQESMQINGRLLRSTSNQNAVLQVQGVRILVTALSSLARFS